MPRARRSANSRCRAVGVVHTLVALELNTGSHQAIDSRFNVCHIPAQDGELLWLQPVNRRHPQHDSVRVEDQRKRLFVGDQLQAEHAFIECACFCRIGGRSERNHVAAAKNGFGLASRASTAFFPRLRADGKRILWIGRKTFRYRDINSTNIF